MYNAYFGFSEKPFTIAPNPQFLFMSQRHQEALAHMLYGMQGEGGIMVLTGEVGTGKTTICRRLLEQIPENTNVAYIINPRQSETEMLASICDELHITCEDTQSIKCLTDALNQYLLDTHAKGQHTVLIIDEAQNLETSVLEQLRLLTNLETNDKKLLQIMLLGQPELADVLARKELRQLAQRITSRYHLTPLNKEEVGEYIKHRLEVAGCTKPSIFPASTIQLLYQYSGGVPRLINLIADRALLGAYASEQKQVSIKILNQAKDEVLGHHPKENHTSRQSVFPYILLMLGLLAALWFWNKQPETIATQQSLHVETTPKPEAVQSQTKQPEMLAEPIQDEVMPSDIIIEAETKHDTSVSQENMATQPILPLTHDKNTAFIPVFKAWGMAYNPETDGEACAFARTQGLLCLRQRDNIAQLRSLDRPAVLTVSDNHGKKAYTAITGLTGTTALAATQDNQAEIPLVQLALQSFNDFTLLWKAPQGYREPIRPGQSGALVVHLAEQVTQALNQSWIGAPRTRYDDTLKEQVKMIQRQEGLNPDGVAGPITWIHINRLNHTPAPTLHATQAEQ